MTVEAWARARILALSTSAGSRVYMLKLPQNPTLPAVRLQWIDEVTDQHLRGPNPSTTRLQVDAYVSEGSGDPYAIVRELADDIHGDGLGTGASGLFGFKGPVGSPVALLIENVRLAFRGQPIYEAEEIKALRIRQDYLIDWRAA